MNSKLSLLIAVTFIAGSLLGNVRAADPEYPMPSNAVYDPAPLAANSLTNKLLVYSVDPDNNTLPLKPLTITNKSKHTLYPIMRDANDSAVKDTNGNPIPIALYDPYDKYLGEFRGMIGYKGTDGNYYFGLKPGESIRIRVPLVFWNGARVGVADDGTYLTPAEGQPDPFHYVQDKSKAVIADAEKDPSDPTIIENGVVMWYAAPIAIGPANDTPDQLVEWTIRDRVYLGNPAITARTHGQIPDTQILDLLNYDVSYVDTMALPGLMEGLDVPYQNKKNPTLDPQPYGYIGSTSKIAQFQAKVTAFTASPAKGNNQLLGEYFGGKGWPHYNIPTVDIKIPSAQSLYSDGPAGDVRSSYNNNVYKLSSGGGSTDLINIIVGGQGAAESGRIVSLSTSPDYDALIPLIQKDYIVTSSVDGVIQPGTKVVSVNISTDPTVPSTVKVNQPVSPSVASPVYTFTRPVTDYTTLAISKLWYSWAAFYLNATKNTQTQVLLGSISKTSKTLTFAVPQTGLVEGMQITGPGLPNPNPSEYRGGVIVLEISFDKKSVTLSQVPTENHPPSDNVYYTFVAPQPLPGTPASKDLFNLTFPAEPADPSRVPVEFAKKVYLVMASMAQIPYDVGNQNDPANQIMHDVIGGNMGFIYTLKIRNTNPPYSLEISATIRDMIKSVLRGVSDFIKYPEVDANNNEVWYPDPLIKTGGLRFNAFNLDPFVRFVHVDLGFSGYGFSLDDDTADIGATGATRMLLILGGATSGTPGAVAGLITTPQNPNKWSNQTIYGPVIGTGTWDPTLTGTTDHNIQGASNTSPIVIACENHGLSNGDKIYIHGVVGNLAANTPDVTPPAKPIPFIVQNVTRDTFVLAGTTGSGAYVSGGAWNDGPHPYVTFTGSDINNIFWRVKGDDPSGFQGALLSGTGVQKPGSIRVVQLGAITQQFTRIYINDLLTNPNGTPLSAGTYTWTFGINGP